MITIYKYPIEVVDYQNVEMPIGAEILSAQAQKDILCLWAKVNQGVEGKSLRRFRIYGTGHEVQVDGKFIDTVQMGPLVWHVFEVDR